MAKPIITNSKKPRKKKIGLVSDEKLKELILKFGGRQTDVARYLKLDPSWIHERIHRNPDLVKAVEMAKEQMVDSAMKSLMDCINDKKETSIIFTLKTLGRNRGFVEHAPLEQVDVSKLKALGDFFAALSPKPQTQHDQGSNDPKGRVE